MKDHEEIIDRLKDYMDKGSFVAVRGPITLPKMDERRVTFTKYLKKLMTKWGYESRQVKGIPLTVPKVWFDGLKLRTEDVIEYVPFP